MSEQVKTKWQRCKVVEKTNHLAVHGLFDSVESAQRHIDNKIPDYVDCGLFMDKTLTKDSFEVITY